MHGTYHWYFEVSTSFYNGEESLPRYTCMHHRHLKTSILRVITQIWETRNLSTSVAGRVFLQTWRILLLFVFFPKRGSASPQKKKIPEGQKAFFQQLAICTLKLIIMSMHAQIKRCFSFQSILAFWNVALGSIIKQHWELTSKWPSVQGEPVANCQVQTKAHVEDRLDLTVANQVRWQPSLDKVILGQRQAGRELGC